MFTNSWTGYDLAVVGSVVSHHGVKHSEWPPNFYKGCKWIHVKQFCQRHFAPLSH